MSVRTLYTVRSRTATASPARRNGYVPPRWPRGRTSRRMPRKAAVHSSATSKKNRTSVRVTLNPLAKNARYPGIGALLRRHPADGEDDLVGVAGEQVAAAAPTRRQEPVAAGAPVLDEGAVGGRGARHHPPRLLLHPAEGGDVVVGAQQEGRLRGARLRRQVGLPLREPVRPAGDPARQVRCVPVPHGAREAPAPPGRRSPGRGSRARR